MPRVDERGVPIDEAKLKLMHTTMQTLGRVAIISGGILVALINLYLFNGVESMPKEQVASIYEQVYLLALVIPVGAGTIIGTVRAERKGGATNDAACGDAYKQSRALKFVEVKNYEDEHDFVVHIVGPVGTNNPVAAAPKQIVTEKKISQKGAMFAPHVLPILGGTVLEWPLSILKWSTAAKMPMNAKQRSLRTGR